MLKQLRMTNFRRFDEHELPLSKRTIIVGPNNAGKSTIVEALRLVSFVANRYRSLTFERVPPWLSDPAGNRGVSPSTRDLNTDLRTAFHAYREPPAMIEARFESGLLISVYIGPDEKVFAVIHDADGRLVTSRAQAYQTGLHRIAIQPQIGPLAADERVFDPETVRRALDSPLASAHFRNQLWLLQDSFRDEFFAAAESSWPGLQLRELTKGQSPEQRLSLLVRDGPFVGEVAAMGHGLQMWLQVIWFLIRNGEAPTVILDEPDVYMHADLQRKLMRMLQSAHQQVMVATHSVEIMAEVEPSDILVVDSRQPKSRVASGLSGVQKVIDSIGGVHNIQFSRLANSRRCIFVEGEDMAILKRWHDTLYPTADALDLLPRLSVGGWDGWQKVVGTAQFLKNSAGDVVRSYCLFDSDFHFPDEVVARYEEAERLGVQLWVWDRKEIENYLLSATAIHRVLESGVRRGQRAPEPAEIDSAIETIAQSLLEEVTDDRVTTTQSGTRGMSAGTASRLVRQYTQRRLGEPDGLRSVVPGKTIIQRLSSWSQQQCGVTFGPAVLAKRMVADEMPDTVRRFLTSLESNRRLPSDSKDLWRRRVAVQAGPDRGR